MTRWRRLVGPALTTIFFLAVLIGLGTWQVYRLHWKEGILARIAVSESGPALPLGAHPSPYQKVSVTGHFLYHRASWFGVEVRDTPNGPVMGSFQIVPLERANAPPVLVERGWVPQTGSAAPDDPSGTVTVEGYIRPAERKSWLAPTDDTAGGHFYTLDPAAIGAAAGIADPAPFVLVALGTDAGGAYPAPAPHLPRPPNNHLSYAITWYGLALALAVIFATRARGALRT